MPPLALAAAFYAPLAQAAPADVQQATTVCPDGVPACAGHPMHQQQSYGGSGSSMLQPPSYGPAPYTNSVLLPPPVGD